VKKTHCSKQGRCVSWLFITLLLGVGFCLASGCDMGTYATRYDGPEPKGGRRAAPKVEQGTIPDELEVAPDAADVDPDGVKKTNQNVQDFFKDRGF